MQLEHRRSVNFNEIKRKDFQINKIVDQIRLRDDFINNANNEFKKKKVPFKYLNDNLKSLEEVDIEPMRLPVIIQNNQVNNTMQDIPRGRSELRKNIINNELESPPKKTARVQSAHRNLFICLILI